MPKRRHGSGSSSSRHRSPRSDSRSSSASGSVTPSRSQAAAALLKWAKDGGPPKPVASREKEREPPVKEKEPPLKDKENGSSGKSKNPKEKEKKPPAKEVAKGKKKAKATKKAADEKEKSKPQPRAKVEKVDVDTNLLIEQVMAEQDAEAKQKAPEEPVVRKRSGLAHPAPSLAEVVAKVQGLEEMMRNETAGKAKEEASKPEGDAGPKPEDDRPAQAEQPAKEVPQDLPAKPPEDTEDKRLEVEIENLKEMLREKEEQKGKEPRENLKKEIDKEIGILTGWLREKERLVVERDKRKLQETLKEKQSEAKRKKEELEQAQRAARAAAAVPATGEAALEVATVPSVGDKVPPIDLPLWCVIPNQDDIVTRVELRRRVPRSSAPKRILLGRRAWVLLGRRLPPPAQGPEPDIGLASPRASRQHALILRNWQGKIFLMDLKSAHGTFLGSQKLPPKLPVEWPVGITAYFADQAREIFEVVADERHRH